MRAIHDIGYQKEEPTSSGASRSEDFQDEGRTKRFEELEKKLRRLEDMRFSRADFQDAAGRVQDAICRTEGDSQTALHGTLRSSPEWPDEQIEQIMTDSEVLAGQNGSEVPAPPAPVHQIMIREPIALLDRLPEHYLSASRAQLGVLRAQAIQERRAEMAHLAQETIEETHCQLDSLAKEISHLLHGEMKKSLDNLTSVLLNRVAHSLEVQIQAAARHSMDMMLGCMKSLAVQSATEPETNRENRSAGYNQGGEYCQKDLSRTLPPATEEIQAKLAALQSDLQSQLRNILHAFQQKAAKQVTKEFMIVAGKLLQTEMNQLQGIQGADEGLELVGSPSGNLLGDTESFSVVDAQKACGEVIRQQASLQDKDNKQTLGRIWRGPAQKLNVGKSCSAAPNWRILGLCLWLIAVGPVVARPWC